METEHFYVSGTVIAVCLTEQGVRITKGQNILHEWELEEQIAEAWYGYVCAVIAQSMIVPTFFQEITWPSHVEKIQELLNETSQSDQFLKSIICSLRQRNFPGPQISLFLGISERRYVRLCHTIPEAI